ncbi:MAG: hypothetical protein SV375_21680 [Thermodesulfobacteriota bacterium]|nr:hypothetical protein [Thermodesulfobacteriota bacterium]
MKEEKTETGLTVPKDDLGLITSSQNQSIFLSLERFEFAKKVASMLAGSDMVPEHFRGRNGVGNCMIMLNLSERLGVDVFGLMQVSYTVHGRPGFESKLPVALFNTRTQLFHPPLRWEMEGDFPKGDDAKCRAYAIDKETGEALYGEWIDWELVKSSGWYDKPGFDKTPKSNFWHTMPGQMFRYRAASFFINAYEPGLKMGIMTVDELEDSIIDVTPSSHDPKETVENLTEEIMSDDTLDSGTDYTGQDLTNEEEIPPENTTQASEPETVTSEPEKGGKARAGDEKVPDGPKKGTKKSKNNEPKQKANSNFIYCHGKEEPVHYSICKICTDKEKCQEYKGWEYAQNPL